MGMETGLTVGTKNMVSLMVEKPLGDLIKPLSHEIHLFDSYIAGTSYVKDETWLDELKEDDKLILQREPENNFDENAILVLDGKKRKLGYIPERDNVVFARLMDAGKYLTAKVKCMGQGTAFKKIYIGIYLVDF